MSYTTCYCRMFSDEKLDATPLNLYNFVPYNQILGNLVEFSAAIYEFCRSNILQQLVLSAYVLNDAHTKCLDSLIVSAHDMQRDVQITPKRLQFAKDKEEALFQQVSYTSLHFSLHDLRLAGVTFIFRICYY